MAKQECPPHIVIVPTPGMGHLIPLVQLATRTLDSFPSFTVTFLVPTMAPPSKAQVATLAALPSDRADSSFLPPVSTEDLPPDAKIETRIALTLARSLPVLRFRLADLARDPTRRLSALVVDLFGTDAFDLCAEFGMKPYIFFPSTAMCLSLFLHLPDLDAKVSCEFKDMDEPVRLPGCVPLHGGDLLDPVQDRKNDAYKWVLHHAKRYRLAEGILVNTFMELEEGALKALQRPDPGKPSVYPVGPMVRSGSGEGGGDGSECLRWLDEQPRGSVMFVSFGSGGTLTYDQLIELAHGLEMSKQRFLWVVRTPHDTSNATYFKSSQAERDPLEFLPKGFLERTKERGLLIPSWAPQIKVLSHESTGGFLSHCGWNSVLESVVHGVPFIAWPLYAEQRMNAVMLTEDLKVTLRPKAGPNGLINRTEIAVAIKGLMEGEEGKRIRNRMKDLKDAAGRAVSEHGSSTKALSEVALKWKSQ